jgi:chaperone modulatory protein CbpM
MTYSLELVASEAGIAVKDLTVWVERRWVRPVSWGGELSFDEADLARLRLIVEFHRDLAIDDEAMPVVLDLIDRLHATREQLRKVLHAVGDMPLSAQIALLARIRGDQES